MNAQTIFSNWTKKAAGMTLDGLVYSIKDCREAAEAVRGHDPIAEGRYMDEMAAYVSELNNRKA